MDRVTVAERKGRFEMDAPNVPKMEGHDSPSSRKGRGARLPLHLWRCLITPCYRKPTYLGGASVLDGTRCALNHLPRWPDDVALAWATRRSAITRSQTDRETAA